jgi:hypothetical protein
MGPRKRALAMLRQPFGPIKTKRVWFNETGAGVVLARLGRGVRPRHGMGRAFPPSKPSATNLRDDHARCGGRVAALRATPQAVSPSPRGGPLVTLRCDPAAAPDPVPSHAIDRPVQEAPAHPDRGCFCLGIGTLTG